MLQKISVENGNRMPICVVLGFQQTYPLHFPEQPNGTLFRVTDLNA